MNANHRNWVKPSLDDYLELGLETKKLKTQLRKIESILAKSFPGYYVPRISTVRKNVEVFRRFSAGKLYEDFPNKGEPHFFYGSDDE
jgi:hypothetical protein